MQSLGERIALLRKKQNLSQRQLMEILKFENLSKYEKDQRQPSYEILISIAEFFNVTTDWLLTGKIKEVKGREDNKLHNTLGELTNEEVKLIGLFRQLEDDRERAKVEGMLEMKVYETKESKKGMSSTYPNGEEAATKEKRHA
ncbi:MAG TPA: helix-turn-helix transcriptional regulator [Bacillus bacterium]|nr:helix-turn-helix transcriptional regulator [Bacillus sp. (in: firmicutes)]